MKSEDSRFSESLGGSEYEDLLLAMDFYDEFQAETGVALQRYIQKYCRGFETISVLEAGPGTGITTLQLLNSDPRVKIIAVDNEQKMLDEARNRFKQTPSLSNRVNFELSDILNYLETCEDESFDVFASVYTLHNFNPAYRVKVLESITKKLKHGGIFINGDKYAEGENAHKKALANELKNYDKFIVIANDAEKAGDLKSAEHFRKIRKEWEAHMWEDEKNRITVEEQDMLFKRLGFTEVEWGKRFDLVVTVTARKL